MGERDLGSSAISGPSSTGLQPLLAPLVLLVFLTLLSLARPLQAPGSPHAVAHCLGAASLARDGDLGFDATDLERLRGFVQTESLGVLLARAPGSSAPSFPDDLLSMAYLAPFAGVGGLRGVLLGHALALAVAMGLAATTLRQRLEAPWRLLLVCLFGSVTVVFLMEPRLEILVLSAVVAAFALAYRGETPRYEELPEVFDDRSRAGRFAPRWLLVGALLGYALLSHPVYLLLFVPAVMALPPAARRSGATIVALGAVPVLAAAVLGALALGGALPWVSPLAIFTPAGGIDGAGGQWSDGAALPSLLAGARPLADLPLAGWNLLFVAVGRSIGALPYYLPLVLLLALWEPRARRSTLVVTAALAAVLTVIVWPFDFAGDAVGLGNTVLLPIYGALWLVPTRRCGLVAPLALLVVAGLFLWPAWLQTAGLRAAGSASGSMVAPVASRFLPHESTRRPLGGDYFLVGNLRALPAGGALEQRRGRLFLVGGRWGNVVLASSVPLQRVYFAFDGQAGSELEVVGGTLGNTLFGGDGGVGFEVELGGRVRRHRLWFSSEPQSMYDLRLRLPNAPRVPVAFGLEGDSEP